MTLDRRLHESGIMCGEGHVYFATSAGIVRASTGFALAYSLKGTYGEVVQVQELADLLDLRRRLIERRVGSGLPECVASCIAPSVIRAIGYSGDPAGIEVLSQHLNDRDQYVAASSATALIRLGERQPELRPMIRKAAFSNYVLNLAEIGGTKTPPWLRG